MFDEVIFYVGRVLLFEKVCKIDGFFGPLSASSRVSKFLNLQLKFKMLLGWNFIQMVILVGGMGSELPQ